MMNQRHLTLLKQDVKAWNYWRQKNSEIELDFSEANLSKLNLSGVNLNRVNLSRVNLNKTNLQCASLKGANLYQACLINANLSGSDLSEANLTEANLTRANISFANLTEANLTKVKALLTNFQSAILTGTCLESWEINEHTNLEPLVCDYFYGKSQQQQRYPQNELQNFAPGECSQFIINNFNQAGAIVFADNYQQSDHDGAKINEESNLSESIGNNWEAEQKSEKLELINPSKSSEKNIVQKASMVNFYLALFLGSIIIVTTIGQVFKKAPVSSDNLINCNGSLLEKAEEAIFIRDEDNLKQLLNQLEGFDGPLGGLVDEKCQHILHEVKYVYAIHIQATRDNNLLEAVKLLCQLPEQYYQQKKHKPWFLRWTNSLAHTDFPQKLAEYIQVNDCPAYTYLSRAKEEKLEIID